MEHVLCLLIYLVLFLFVHSRQHFCPKNIMHFIHIILFIENKRCIFINVDTCHVIICTETNIYVQLFLYYVIKLK